MGYVEHGLASGKHCFSLAMMHRRGRQQAEAPVMVLVVLPLKELRAEVLGVFETVEAIGELRPVLERLKLTLRVRIVVRDIRAAMRLDDA